MSCDHFTGERSLNFSARSTPTPHPASRVSPTFCPTGKPNILPQASQRSRSAVSSRMNGGLSIAGAKASCAAPGKSPVKKGWPRAPAADIRWAGSGCSRLLRKSTPWRWNSSDTAASCCSFAWNLVWMADPSPAACRHNPNCHVRHGDMGTWRLEIRIRHGKVAKTCRVSERQ
jgi:hypothetical protein